MNDPLELKEQIIEDFIQTISNIGSKPCYEIENSLEKIVHKSRGLIHKQLVWHKKCCYTLQLELEKQGFKVSFATIYRDMTSINQKNTWVRDLASSNYSAYQESISQNLEWIE